jgi:putative nucleotidyltransferase-like protein
VSRSLHDLQVVFLLAGCEERRARFRALVHDVLAGSDQARLARDLSDRRLLTLIGSRAIAAAPDAASAKFREAVARARSTGRARALALEAVTARAVHALGAVDIRALPLKGPLLAAEAYGDVGLRETSDIDLLVEPGALDAAVDVLRGLGYGEPPDVRRPNGLPDLHFEMRHPSLPTVELHWRVYWYESAFSEQLLARAEPGDDGLLRARPDDLMASLLLFYARDGFHGVRVAADIAAWWDRHGATLPARFLDGYLARFPELEPALTAAATAAERLTGAPANTWLGAAAPRAGRVATAARLADWAQAGDIDQMSANISLAAALLRPRGSLAEFARREFLLSGERPTAIVIHAVKVAVRYAIALWKVRGSRTWARPPAGVPCASMPRR